MSSVELGGKYGQPRCRLAQDRGEQRQQAQEEHLGDDREEHRGARRGAGEDNFINRSY
ncbi:hypothetical protein ES703_122204 [subsurface metagenome]